MKHHRQFLTLLHRYFGQQISQQERWQVVNRLADDEADIPELEQLMDAVWAEGGDKPLDMETSTALLQSIFMDDAVNRKKIRRVRTFKLPQWLSAAAVLTLIVSMVFWYAHRQQQVQQAMNHSPGWQQINNSGSHIKHVMLADGSQVWLATGSTLSYPSSEATGSRLLRISGEAFFDIARDAKRPMSVLAGGTVTAVLGTAFHIAAYPNEPGVYVSLLRGRVAVTAAGTASLDSLHPLFPGQLFSWQRPTGQSTTQRFDSTTVMASIKGQMAFYELNLYDALQRVGLRYGLTINVSPQLISHVQHQKVTGVFTSENREEIIRNILFVHGYHYSIKGKIVTIIP